MSKTKSKTDFWPELIRHIDESWKKKKGRAYMFSGKDMGLLKIMARYFTVPELMALWSTYLYHSTFWGPKTGYLIPGFYEERSVLLDDPNFKRLVPIYEKELQLREPKELTLDLGITCKTVGGNREKTEASRYPD